MKKMLAALVAIVALAAVTAASAAAPSLTINVSNRTVVFGGSPNLNGTAAPNATVTITARPFNQPSWSTQVKTNSSGVWQLGVVPWVQTRYQANDGTATSDETVIFVKPRIDLVKKGNGHYEVIVAAGTSFVGKQVMLGKQVGKTRSTLHWVMVKKIVLKTNARTDGT